MEATQITDPEIKNESFNAPHGGVFTNSTASVSQIGRNIMVPIGETIHASSKTRKKHGKKYSENRQAKKCSVGCMPKRLGPSHKHD